MGQFMKALGLERENSPDDAIIKLCHLDPHGSWAVEAGRNLQSHISLNKIRWRDRANLRSHEI